MENQKKNRKPLFIILIIAVVALATLSAVLMGQAGSGKTAGQTDATDAAYALYWNVDRLDYQVEPGKEVGTTGREPGEDGYYHVLFAKDGEQLDLRIIDRRLTNRIDGVEPGLMGLVFDEDGIVIDFIQLEDMPVEQLLWSFFVQSMSADMIKLNSSAMFDGLEEIIKIGDGVVILDISGQSEYIGAPAEPKKGDRVYVIANEDGDVTHIFLYERAS